MSEKIKLKDVMKDVFNIEETEPKSMLQVVNKVIEVTGNKLVEQDEKIEAIEEGVFAWDNIIGKPELYDKNEIDQIEVDTVTYIDDGDSELSSRIDGVVFSVTQVNGRVDSVESELTQLDGKVDGIGDYVIGVENNVIQLQTGKQDKLIAGDNITIDETTNVIRASGGLTTVTWQDVENKPELYSKGEIDQLEINTISYVDDIVGNIDSILDGILGV